MTPASKPSRRADNKEERIRKNRALLITILIGLVSAGFIAAMILWGYYSERFSK